MEKEKEQTIEKETEKNKISLVIEKENKVVVNAIQLDSPVIIQKDDSVILR